MGLLYLCLLRADMMPLKLYCPQYGRICILFLDIPSIEISSKSKVIFGSETRLNCQVCGYPPPDKVEWQNSVDGTTFHPIDIDGDKHCGSSTDPRSSYLLVRKASLKDQLYYRVVVSNLIGKCISNTLFLQVTGSMFVYLLLLE